MIFFFPTATQSQTRPVLMPLWPSLLETWCFLFLTGIKKENVLRDSGMQNSFR